VNSTVLQTLTFVIVTEITNITKGCEYDRHFVLYKKFFWRFNILFSTKTRQICAELANAQITRFISSLHVIMNVDLATEGWSAHTHTLLA